MRFWVTAGIRHVGDNKRALSLEDDQHLLRVAGRLPMSLHPSGPGHRRSSHGNSNTGGAVARLRGGIVSLRGAHARAGCARDRA
eukprot:5815981-Pyramimonas_sp.AAC.1